MWVNVARLSNDVLPTLLAENGRLHENDALCHLVERILSLVLRKTNTLYSTAFWNAPKIDDELHGSASTLKSVALKPHQESALSWMLAIEQNVSSGQEYTVPMFLPLAGSEHDLGISVDLSSPPYQSFVCSRSAGCTMKLRSRGGVYADEMGLGKTVTIIALIAQLPRNGVSAIWRTPSKIESGATLVIVPAQLVKQWQAEIAKYAPKLSCKLMRDRRDFRKTSIQEIAAFDVVIMSHLLFWRAESYLAFREVGWHRIVIDEAHELYGRTLDKMAGKVHYGFAMFPCNTFWYVSGTPFPKLRKSILRALLLICGPLDALRKVDEFIFPPESASLYEKKHTPPMKHEIVNTWELLLIHTMHERFYWRGTKLTTQDDVIIPKLTQEIKHLELSPIERAYYVLHDGALVSNRPLLRELCNDLSSVALARQVLGLQVILQEREECGHALFGPMPIEEPTKPTDSAPETMKSLEDSGTPSAGGFGSVPIEASTSLRSVSTYTRNSVESSVSKYLGPAYMGYVSTCLRLGLDDAWVSVKSHRWLNHKSFLKRIHELGKVCSVESLKFRAATIFLLSLDVAIHRCSVHAIESNVDDHNRSELRSRLSGLAWSIARLKVMEQQCSLTPENASCIELSHLVPQKRAVEHFFRQHGVKYEENANQGEPQWMSSCSWNLPAKLVQYLSDKGVSISRTSDMYSAKEVIADQALAMRRPNPASMFVRMCSLIGKLLSPARLDAPPVKGGMVARYMSELLREDPDAKVIVFTRSPKLADRMMHVISECDGCAVVACKGSHARRSKALARFGSRGKDSANVIVLSLEYSASGADLSICSHIIITDPLCGERDNVQAQDAQAIARSHRLGQTQEVKVVRLIVKDSVEEEDYRKAFENEKQSTLPEAVLMGPSLRH
eukprot:TRINITY_DN11186_c0_g1_i3.p1 TRINITY_DN11186_c0_g1~~TRINITY_DN11186_c0_g1_i3.p1  ORF type:complete len:899 (-),score=92.83 TRINITY_DN11186_c0_g1_i3:349-3045(-)